LSLFYSIFNVQLPITYNQICTYIIFFLSGLLSVWLAGWKFRLVDIVFTGMVILGVAFLVEALLTLLASSTAKGDNVCETLMVNIIWILMSLGSPPVLTNVLQLAIKQIPEASSSQLSSLACGYIFSSFFAIFFSALFHTFMRCYFTSDLEIVKCSPY